MNSPIPQVEPSRPPQAGAEKRSQRADAAIPFAWWLQQAELAPAGIAREESPSEAREPSGNAQEAAEPVAREDAPDPQPRQQQRPEGEIDASMQAISPDTSSQPGSSEEPAAQPQEQSAAAAEEKPEASRNGRQAEPSPAAGSKLPELQQARVDPPSDADNRRPLEEPTTQVLEQSAPRPAPSGLSSPDPQQRPAAGPQPEGPVLPAAQNLTGEAASGQEATGEEPAESPEAEETPHVELPLRPGADKAAGNAAFAQGENVPSRGMGRPESAPLGKQAEPESAEPKKEPRPRASWRYAPQAPRHSLESTPSPGTLPTGGAGTNEGTPAQAEPSTFSPGEATLQGENSLGSPSQEPALPPRIEHALQRVEQQLSQVPEVGASKSPAAEGSGKPTPGMDGPGKPETQKLLLRVVQAMRQAAHRRGVVRMKLHPPELGSVELQLRLRRGEVEAELRVESTRAQQALLENLHQLRQRLAEQDVKILRFEVDVMNQPPGHFTGRQGSGQQRSPLPPPHIASGVPPGVEAEPEVPGAGHTLGTERVDVVV